MVEIKGSVVLESQATARKRLGEHRYQEVLDLLDDQTRAMFLARNRAVNAVSWFPLDAFVRFLEADIKVSDNGRETALITRSEATIERQLRGIYRIFVKLSRPESLVQKVAAIHETYFRGVQIEKKIEDNKRGATIRYMGFQKEHRLIGFAIIGFYRKALQLCGARDVKVEFTTAIEEEKGYAELVMSWG